MRKCRWKSHRKKTDRKWMITVLAVFSMLLFFLAADPVGATDGISILTIHDLKTEMTVDPGGVTDTDLFNTFKNMVPGDRRIQEIQVQNECREGRPVRIFLSNRAHSEKENPLSPEVAEKESLASNDAFLKALAMKIRVNDLLVYEGNAGEILKEPIPLGLIPWAEGARIQVEVEIPPEYGNDYADRMGETDWVFLVEDNGNSQPEFGTDGQVTVRKVWTDGNENHEKDAVTVYLKKDGIVWDSVVLSKANQWTHVFEGLEKDQNWSVSEIQVPSGYEDKYVNAGERILIINHALHPVGPKPSGKTELCVLKKWAESEKKHPDFVKVTLFDGKRAVETVRLSEENHWTYLWTGLDAGGNWQVEETACKGNFKPSYEEREDGTVVITNTASLIQTGQTCWGLLLLAGLGLLFIILGLFLKKKRKEDEEC